LLFRLFTTKVYGYFLGILWKFFPRGSVFSQTNTLNKMFVPDLPRSSLTSLIVQPANACESVVEEFAGNLDSIAMVIQGKIGNHDSFSVKSIYEYSRLFPKATLILSTWVDAPADVVTKLQLDGILVILNEYPPIPGFGNFNYQMKSTKEGLLFAKKLGFKIAIKVRSDQRITSIHALDYMRIYLENNILPTNSGGQNKRLGFISLDSFAFRLYGLSDMLHFGDIDDLLTYWSGEEDLRDKNEMNLSGTLREYSSSQICEVRLFVNFLKAYSWDLKWTLEDYWCAVAERCIVIDSTSIKLYWPKYSVLENKWDDSSAVKYTQISNAFWMRAREGTLLPNDSILDQY